MSDNSLQCVIKDWSSHILGLAKAYNINLDYSEESIDKVENLCELIHQEIISKPDSKEENIQKVCKIIGSYLGEIIIKYLGGEWKLNVDSTIAIRLNKFECYPIEKVYKRLKNGSSDNISFYYKVCRKQIDLLK